MVDKVIGELPSISSLDDESLFVAEQNGQAVKVSGKQLTDFSNVETTAQVEQAKASAQAAKTAQDAAEAAILKSPIIQNGTWWVYNQTAGAYQDTGINATGPKGDTGPQGIPGPTASVNGISPDGSGNITLTASNVNAYSKTETNTLLQNKAPAGYGLGSVSKALSESDDLNNIVTNGWYCWDGLPLHGPTYTVHNYGVTYSKMLVLNRGLYDCAQFVFTQEGNILVRTLSPVYPSWSEWEWLNPPMLLGVEYRTTERYLGKPVYVQIIDCGSMPDIGSEKNISIAAFNVGVVTFISGWCTYYGAVIDPNIFGIALSANTANIRIENLKREVNSNAVIYALVKYAKKTD